MQVKSRILIILTTALAVAAVVLTPTTAVALPPGEVAYAGTRVVINNLDFRREAFEVDNDGRLLHQWEFTPGGNDWSQKQPLGGSGRLIYDQISVERNRDGRLEVFGVGTNKKAYHIWQRTPGGNWGPFYSLGGGFDGPVTAGKNADGRLEVFGIGETGAMYHAWQTSAGGSWTGWYSLGAGPYDPFVLAPFSPGVGIYHDGSLFVRIWDIEAYHWEKYQVTPGGAWLGNWVGA